MNKSDPHSGKNPVLAIAFQELRLARTNRLAMLLLAIFVGMVLLSGFIGWATHQTVTDVYNETVREGATSAPNPFSSQEPLELMKNTVIYVVLIGTLLAIVLGVQSGLADRKAGVIDMIFSRQLRGRQYVIGKLLGMQFLMAMIIACAGAISWAAILLISGRALDTAEALSLAGFLMLAWLFLLPFNCIGLACGSVGRRESGALLAPMLAWVILTFVMPQLGTAEHPVALLNPVAAQPTAPGSFFDINRTVLKPLSLTERFKDLSSSLLHLGGGGASPWLDLFMLAAAGLLGCLTALYMVKRDALRRPLYE